jgi:hypothetical protein
MLIVLVDFLMIGAPDALMSFRDLDASGFREITSIFFVEGVQPIVI